MPLASTRVHVARKLAPAFSAADSEDMAPSEPSEWLPTQCTQAVPPTQELPAPDDDVPGEVAAGSRSLEEWVELGMRAKKARGQAASSKGAQAPAKPAAAGSKKRVGLSTVFEEHGASQSKSSADVSTSQRKRRKQSKGPDAHDAAWKAASQQARKRAEPPSPPVATQQTEELVPTQKLPGSQDLPSTLSPEARTPSGSQELPATQELAQHPVVAAAHSQGSTPRQSTVGPAVYKHRGSRSPPRQKATHGTAGAGRQRQPEEDATDTPVSTQDLLLRTEPRGSSVSKQRGGGESSKHPGSRSDATAASLAVGGGGSSSMGQPRHSFAELVRLGLEMRGGTHLEARRTRPGQDTPSTVAAIVDGGSMKHPAASKDASAVPADGGEEGEEKQSAPEAAPALPGNPEVTTAAAPARDGVPGASAAPPTPELPPGTEEDVAAVRQEAFAKAPCVTSSEVTAAVPAQSSETGGEPPAVEVGRQLVAANGIGDEESVPELLRDVLQQLRAQQPRVAAARPTGLPDGRAQRPADQGVNEEMYALISRGIALTEDSLRETAERGHRIVCIMQALQALVQ